MQSRPVTILLCTYNGAAHLRAQLESLLGQTYRDWALWVSDDASQDETQIVLQQFASENPDREIRLMSGPGQGAAANFLSLMCHPDLDERFVALCDQDDVWMPEKLASAMTALGTGFAAYGAQSIVTDCDLKPIGRLRNLGRGPSFQNALVQNILHGATIVLAPQAHRLVRQAGAGALVPFHDWWLYQLLTGCGLLVFIDPKPVLFYRQHQDNEIGANRSVKAAAKRGAMFREGRYRGWVRDNMVALNSVRERLTDQNKATLDRLAWAQERSGARRSLAYCRLGLRRQSAAGTVLLLVMAALGYA